MTWGSETSGVSGTISATNSLIGSNSNDHVGYNNIIILPDGNYLVDSLHWNSNVGACNLG